MKEIDFVKSTKINRLLSAVKGEQTPMKMYSTSSEKNIEKTVLYSINSLLYYDAWHQIPVPSDDLPDLFIDGIVIMIESGNGNISMYNPLFIEFVRTDSMGAPEDNELTGVVWTFDPSAFKSENIFAQPVPENMAGSDGAGLFMAHCCDENSVYVV